MSGQIICSKPFKFVQDAIGTVPSKSNRPPLSSPMITYRFLLNNIGTLKFLMNLKILMYLYYSTENYVNMGEDRGGLLLLDGTVYKAKKS